MYILLFFRFLNPRLVPVTGVCVCGTGDSAFEAAEKESLDMMGLKICCRFILSEFHLAFLCLRMEWIAFLFAYIPYTLASAMRMNCAVLMSAGLVEVIFPREFHRQLNMWYHASQMSSNPAFTRRTPNLCFSTRAWKDDVCKFAFFICAARRGLRADWFRAGALVRSVDRCL